MIEEKFYCFILFYMLTVVHGQDQGGFISLACGTPANYSYTNSSTTITYTSDAKYISTGIGKNISDAYSSNSISKQYTTLRSFPSGARNCYTLKNIDRGSRYLVRAFFLYGNYDGNNSASVVFDLHIGVHRWTTVNITDMSSVYSDEIIMIAPTSYISVCLVNKGSGTPFISVLELRPLKLSMYSGFSATENVSLVLVARRNFEGDREIRFSEDPYDRIWRPLWNPWYWDQLSTTEPVKHSADDGFEIPSPAVSKAAASNNKTFPIMFYWNDMPEDNADERSDYHVAMHFAELVSLSPTASRNFSIYLNGDIWYEFESPSYLQVQTIYTITPITTYFRNFSINATKTATLPPIINALEVFYVRNTPAQLATDDGDVDSINSVKDYFRVKRNWSGDPCAPKLYAWDGLNCRYNDSEKPRITSLNLSFSQLTGGIPDFLANLKELQYLDLSSNNLTGTIPESLAALSSLVFLNLSYNQLNGQVPQALLDKQSKGTLILSVTIKKNVVVCNGTCDCVGACGKKGKLSAATFTTLVVLLAVVVLVLVAFAWRMKSRRGRQALSPTLEPGDDHSNYDNSSLISERRSFSYIELEKITNNFERVIGKGGFGIVYHGYLENGNQVAVKMHRLSSLQGIKEFLAEAKSMTRVHHRNLVSLVGYYRDENYMALVYEYMAGGSLQDYLKVTEGNTRILSWLERLRIALQAAQGLEYLHRGCIPPIVHRDVKSSNILLNEKREAKIADFGLSKPFPETVTHVSTGVFGTLGYLDPEYYSSYQLNEKSDVYSFGVVLLELITGLQAILAGSDKSHIIHWVRPKLARGNIAQVVDQRLEGEYEPNSAWKIADIAMRSTFPASIQRPTMTDVVAQLKEAVELATINLSIVDINRGETVVFDLDEGKLGPSVR